MIQTLHLMTQRDQPYGSVRKCCEICGLMMVDRDAAFWREHGWVDDPDEYKYHPSDEHHGGFKPCNQKEAS